MEYKASPGGIGALDRMTLFLHRSDLMRRPGNEPLVEEAGAGGCLPSQYQAAWFIARWQVSRPPET